MFFIPFLAPFPFIANQFGDLGKHCKLPQRGLEHSYTAPVTMYFGVFRAQKRRLIAENVLFSLNKILQLEQMCFFLGRGSCW